MRLKAKLKRKIKNAFNQLGRRCGVVPREYMYVNGVDISLQHRNTSADVACIVQCVMRREYELPEVGGDLAGCVDLFYTRLIQEQKVPLIIDAGANIGASAIWFATRFPGARIVAIEPAADNYELLRLNVHEFNVECRCAAVAAKGGRAMLIDAGVGTWGYRTTSVAERGEITVLTLNEIVSTAQSNEVPFILKMDIEGGEVGIFDGDDNPARLFPVVTIEPHDWMLPGQGTSHSFLRFHVENNRDFLSKGENVFSVDFAAMKS